MTAQNVDVVAVAIDGGEVLWVKSDKSPRFAEAVIKDAIRRQGCEDRYFTTAALGKFRAGDKFTAEEAL